MRAFWGIVKLTIRHALRSRVFLLLLALLLLAIAVIPGTVDSSGATDFIKVMLFYGLWSVSIILILSSVWLGCFVMTSDMEKNLLHLVAVKPVRRSMIWMGKWTGVVLMHLFLLALAGGAVYGIVQYRLAGRDFREEDRKMIRDEVLVGRRAFLPRKIDIAALAKRMLDEKIRKLRAEGSLLDTTSPGAVESMYKDVYVQAEALAGEVPFNARRSWVYDDIPLSMADRNLSLRYRPYVDQISTDKQRMTRFRWEVGVPQITREDPKKKDSVFQKDRPAYEMYVLPLSDRPVQLLAGQFHELLLRPEWKLLTPDGKIMVILHNQDPEEKALYFQDADGPKLMVEACTFGENYLRALLMIAIGLLISAGLGCAFGGMMSMPTAVFVSMSYFTIGWISVFTTERSYLSGLADDIGLILGRTLLFAVVPMSTFDVTEFLSQGELIEWSLIGSTVLFALILRAIPLFLLGIWVYGRRELGMAGRK